jgi:hypothetical protein
MPGTYAELNAIARKAWGQSVQSEFLEKWMAKAEATMQRAMMCEMGEPLKPLLAHVGPNGNFNEPVEKPISPQSEFIEELAAKAAAERASFIGATRATPVARVTRVEDGKITEITVTGLGTWNEPYAYVLSLEEPDILSITRDVVRSG